MTKHHTSEEMRLCANFLDEMKVNHKVIKDALRISAAMLRDIADADDTTCSDPVAYCDPFDGTNSTAFAWPGKSRDLSRHTLPLYKRPMPRDDTDEKDREDAERYRWLRDAGNATWKPLAKRYMDSCALPTDVDQAIDAAIEAVMKEK